MKPNNEMTGVEIRYLLREQPGLADRFERSKK